MKQQTDPYLIVLGVAQDAGYPQANCNDKCCKDAWENSKKRKFVSCLALVDPQTKQQWIFDATPDIKFQLNLLEKISGLNPLNGIFLTHAHIGHYTGLMQLGREVMGTKNLPVFAMKRMEYFLKNNAPWDQLTKINNINITSIKANTDIVLNEKIKITPFLVPHRDEYSETVGYKIKTERKTVLFIPDIDKWHLWNTDIVTLISKIDYAFIDGTFYKDGELKRDMSSIPHPFVTESMELFKNLSNENKSKIHFIHLNHTNPLLQDNSLEMQEVLRKGFKCAKQEMIINL
ncbi:MAG: MBL fold metallo-hydrolase [Bacteroidota bacterium]|nr:MBL fold metallo-hydrolase [Bacteroidota bacterium]